MQKLVALSAFALGLAVLAAPASAQVVIQGEVTVQQQQPYGYQQPVQSTTYGASPYVQTGAASPQPTRYIHHSDPIGGMIAGGAIGLAGGFVFTLLSELILAGGYSAGCSGFGCPNDDWYLMTWIPVIGPWLGLGLGRGGDYEWVNYIGGILQDAGLLVLILGLVIHDEWDEPIWASGTTPESMALRFTGNGLSLSF